MTLDLLKKRVQWKAAFQLATNDMCQAVMISYPKSLPSATFGHFQDFFPVSILSCSYRQSLKKLLTKLSLPKNATTLQCSVQIACSVFMCQDENYNKNQSLRLSWFLLGYTRNIKRFNALRAWFVCQVCYRVRTKYLVFGLIFVLANELSRL